MKKCVVCGKNFDGPSLCDVLIKEHGDFPIMCDECMEINGRIFDERMGKGQLPPKGIAETRAAIIEYKRRNLR